VRNRQRPTWPDEDLRNIYAGPHDHRALGWGHDARIATTIFIGRLLDDAPLRVADLSCGNGIVARSLNASVDTILGDYAPGFPIRGPIEQTIELVELVDVFVCSETLEHLDDPDSVLRQIRSRSRTLVCSMPLCRTPDDDQNGEHYWAFDRPGAEEMLREAGWEPTYFAEVPAAPGTSGRTYQCGIWGCT